LVDRETGKHNDDIDLQHNNLVTTTFECIP
jgi:hypothetical protein